ncbi:MAG: hypothetical protein KBG29_02590 [Pseudomonadales bacterium]|nr:hypothetical protein [Pseudomonadales bacterium]
MTPTETAALLRQFNVWRRGHHDDTAMPDPREIGRAIDAAVEMIERMENQVPVASIYIDSKGDREFDDWKCDLPTGSNVLYPLPGAQPAPSVPEGWLRAIDEALVVAHIGVANASDTYEQAKAKLDNLIGFHVDVATDPAVNGGWKLVPTAESRHPGIYKMLSVLHAVDNTPGASEWESYAAFLAAAPEAKP